MSFRLSPTLLERYVLRESILPFFLGFGMVTFLFVLDMLFDLLDLLLAKDVPLPVVLELFLLALGWITALSFPCGALVAALMSFGRMAQDNEITALRASGVSLARILRGILVASGVLAVLLALFNNYVLPETNHRFANLRYAIQLKAPAARVEPGIFIDAFDNVSLLVREVDDKTGEMRDITIYDYSETAVPTTIFAKRGHMEYPKGGTTLKLELLEGEIHEVPGLASEGKYRRGRFERHTLYLRQSGARLQRPDRRARSEREMTIAMMQQEIQERRTQIDQRRISLDERAVSLGYADFAAYEKEVEVPRGLASLWKGALGILGVRRPAPPDSAVADPKAVAALQVGRAEIDQLDRRIDSFEVEIHKKLSIPFACVVFVLVGCPLGIRTRKGGFANMAIAVGFFLVYYLFLIAGEQLAERRFVSPGAAMWLPNAVFGVLGLYLASSVMGWGRSRGMR